jgi:hypothetical protein
MDPLSIIVSTTALIEFTGEAIGYINAVKTSSKDRAKLAIELSNLCNLLTNLRYRLEGSDTNEPWYTAARALSVKNGPFDQYKDGLLELQKNIPGGTGSSWGRLKEMKDALTWRFAEKDVADALARMERLKSLVAIALDGDSL